jgi:hypothetical protein
MCQYKLICNPIMELTTLLQSCGFTIDKQELKDWHFNEFEIVMSGKNLQPPMKINIEGIEQYGDNIYCCKCHWSVVKLRMN